MNAVLLFLITLIVIISSIRPSIAFTNTTDLDDDEEKFLSTKKRKIKADVVLIVDTAYYGWGDRSEVDVFVNGLRPFLKEFAECLWSVADRIRVAVVEMAKVSCILVDLNEGNNPTTIIGAFDRDDRRLNDNDRRSTTHIYRMLNLVNSTVCNRSTNMNISCVMILVTVLPAPVRVPFVGADWPSWRSLGDAMIKSSFDLGVDLVVLTTGYHESSGIKRAGLSEMARVEGRIAKQMLIDGDGTKVNWELTYWQADYDTSKNVDRRVAQRTVMTLYQVLAIPEEEKVVMEEVPIKEIPNLQYYEEMAQDEEKGQFIFFMSITTMIGALLGFFLKLLWHLWRGTARNVVRKFIISLIINLVSMVIFITGFWIYDKFF